MRMATTWFYPHFIFNTMYQYTTIIWDWNGTLLDDIQASIDSINPLLLERGLNTIDIEHYRNIFGFPVVDYYSRLGFDFTKEDFSTPAIQFMDNYRSRQHTLKLFDDAVTTLSTLKQQGFRQIMLSAMEDKLLKQMISFFGIEEYLDGVFGIDDDFAHGKAHIGKKMIEVLKLNTTECLMIGDTAHDAEVADLCGFDCILYAGGHFSKTRLTSLNKPIINKLSELLSWLNDHSAALP